MRIDAHQHFWNYDPQRHPWISDEMAVLKRDFQPHHLLPELGAAGIDGCVVVEADQREDETFLLLDLAEKNAFVRGVVGWVDLRGESVGERLRHFARFPKLCGFRHVLQAEPDDNFMLRPDFCHGIGKLQEFGFTYDLLIFPKHLPAAVQLTKRFPAQRFVIDHMAKPLIREQEIATWAADMRRIAANPNVYCKLSGLVTEADWRHWRVEDFIPYLDVVFEAFGAQRLMFGSDWPVCLLAASYRQVKELIEMYTGKLASAEQEGIFGGNAITFYGLKNKERGNGSNGPRAEG